jgi:hypothetical protein
LLEKLKRPTACVSMMLNSAALLRAWNRPPTGTPSKFTTPPVMPRIRTSPPTPDMKFTDIRAQRWHTRLPRILLSNATSVAPSSTLTVPRTSAKSRSQRHPSGTSRFPATTPVTTRPLHCVVAAWAVDAAVNAAATTTSAANARPNMTPLLRDELNRARLSHKEICP